MPALPIPSRPPEFRAHCRSGAFTGPTAGICPGFAQANLVIVPERWADDFDSYCRRNHQACPLLERTPAGAAHLERLAQGVDLRTDLPRYAVYEDGRCVDRPTAIVDRWQDDFVSFLLGCSFTFESALLRAGLPVRHLEGGPGNVPMYRTNIATEPAGPFAGPLVVSMRPMTREQADRAISVCVRYPEMHGAPVHLGDPSALGIGDLDQPDWGDRVEVRSGEIPVFWACGVTPQAALASARIPLAITHAAGHMFVSDCADRLFETDIAAGG